VQLTKEVEKMRVRGFYDRSLTVKKNALKPARLTSIG
jgi:hypothetical protein